LFLILKLYSRPRNICCGLFIIEVSAIFMLPIDLYGILFLKTGVISTTNLIIRLFYNLITFFRWEIKRGYV
jgi:hypothetical protein